MTDAQWHTVQQVADAHGISAQTVLRYIGRGVIAAADVKQEKSRGRKGWRYLIAPDVRLHHAAPDPAPEPTPYADPAPTECTTCATFRAAMRGCVRVLLGDCDCPKCLGVCECARV